MDLRLENGFEEIHHAIIIINSEGKYLAYNKAARELLGISNSLIGKKAHNLLALSTSLTVLKTGISVLHEKVNYNGNLLVANHKPIFDGEKIIGVVTSLQNISELEKAVLELEDVKELNKELEAIFNSSFDEIYVTDGNGYTLRVNKAGEEFCGVNREELVGKHVSELEKRGLFSPCVTPQVIKEKKRITSIQTTKSGKKIIVTSNPVFDENGEIIRVVTNSRDVTELNNLRQRLEDTEKLMNSYRAEILKLRKERLTSIDIIGRSSTMKHILDLAEKIAKVDSTILVEGESGVGKGLIASKIHQFSPRHAGAFITVNCGAIPENLIESELFGYDAGSFTGAKKEGKKGLFEMAHGGTIFLDEISELPLNLQVKLLHVIQDKKLMRVGGSDYVRVDVRIIAATNRNIQRLIKEGRFREDLYYRLNVVPLIVPPLRHRKDDIPVLIDYFLESILAKYELRKKISLEAINQLAEYNWPGNVRELENLVERLVVTVDHGEILPRHLPDYILHSTTGSEKVLVLELCSLKDATEELERQLLKKALEQFKNTYRMAEVLKVDQSTIVRKMHRYEILKENQAID